MIAPVDPIKTLEQDYIFKSPERIAHFLRLYPYLMSLLADARQHIRQAFPDSDVRPFIPQWFTDEDDPSEKKVGALLSRLHDRRRRADYDNNVSNPETLAEQALDDARVVIEYLAQL